MIRRFDAAALCAVLLVLGATQAPAPAKQVQGTASAIHVVSEGAERAVATVVWVHD